MELSHPNPHQASHHRHLQALQYHLAVADPVGVEPAWDEKDVWTGSIVARRKPSWR